jgi:O-antigen ligase
VLAGWTLFAFAGVLRWTTVPVIAASIVVALVERPRIFKAPTRVLDFALLAWLLAAAASLVPLRSQTRLQIAPAIAGVDAALYLDAAAEPSTRPPRPLSVDPDATRWALALGASLVLIFWSARAVCAEGGLRATVRGVAWLGLAVSALAVVQHGTAPELIYWTIRPVGRRPMPFGPFVNRNDLATWLIMAAPLACGYAIARVQSRRAAGRPVDIESMLDSKTLWLAGTVFFMLATLWVTLSRSGLMGALAGGAALMWLARRRMRRAAVGWLAAILATVAAAATTYASWNGLATRVEETLTAGLGGRAEIWARTSAMIADFPLTGVGVGAYERAMTVYQSQPHVFYFNHAHSEYLQLAAEGGVMLGVPAVIALAAGGWLIWRRIHADRTAVFWIRAGAASGLVAAAVQSVWETGLRLPANAVIFAILVAVAVHDGRKA